MAPLTAAAIAAAVADTPSGTPDAAEAPSGIKRSSESCEELNELSANSAELTDTCAVPLNAPLSPEGSTAAPLVALCAKELAGRF
jgi:hypothetical protein